jgi:hypothetical protein
MTPQPDWSPDANAAAMRRRSLPPLKTIERKLDEVAAIRAEIAHDTLVELWRRAEQGSDADGYPASSMGSGVHTSDADSSTETAALADDSPDEVIAALVEACAEVAEMHGLARRVGRRLKFAKARGESHRGRQATGGDCGCCDTFVSGAPEDRMRSGLCEACYRSWLRYRLIPHDDPGAHRRRFIRQRRSDLSEEKS